MMRKNLYLSIAACSVVLFSSCSKMGSLTAENFNVNPNPLEVKGGNVECTINGTFPKKYMKKKATVAITPELRYSTRLKAEGQTAKFQGEDVMGNDQIISYKKGGRFTMKSSFKYVPEMQKSDLYIIGKTRNGSKVDAFVCKVAEGVIATSELYKKTLLSGGACLALDSFQRINAKKQEANIKFLINQANIRQSELKSNSIQEFVQMLRKINADREQLVLNNVEIQAYASPEGGFSYNDQLASKRQDASEAYVKQTLKSNKVDTDIDAHYTAQDWDGFQQLVQASNIQDKDVILRVLSMYKDPQEREQQIRNMSAGFQELANGILPELRRARLIINYETVGRSDDQIKAQYASDPSKLSLEEILYAASLENSDSKKEEIFKTATQLYDKDYRAYNNIAALAFKKGDYNEVINWLEQAFRRNGKAPESNANLALLSLKDGKVAEAEEDLAEAINANGFGEVLGLLNIAKGNYAMAEENFKNANSTSNSAVLAQILNKNYAGAAATLNSMKNKDAMAEYLTAILNARQKKYNAAAESLRSAIAKDPTLAKYAEKDIELQNVSK